MLTENQEILDGRFKVVKKLGSGAFGEIFKGKLFITCSNKKTSHSDMFSPKEKDWRNVCSEMCKLKASR